ncbi:hypothetical protein ACH5RR_005638 [Cinchona calisaya]|uniref:Cholesterol oxidase n=1 Tax=Cinchona calisaya TaxID=153742 RepID=A0ABD3ALT6_9GENT
MEIPKSENGFAQGDCNSYDAVVIGSGYGGSVAACRMSMAGLKVCLFEKGRKWEAQDFPTNSLEMLSAVRIEQRTFGFTCGPKDALYQVFRQDDSAAVMACGLGGGSLVNAGVMVPAPVRTRRNPKWPKDWELSEAAASTMLKIQNVPVKFKNAKIMDQVVEEEPSGLQNPLKLIVNFDMEDQMYDPKKSQKLDSCQACGNCLSGCPYSAKISTDKTYLVSALEAGCIIRTECEVQYVVRNLDDTCGVEDTISRKKRLRWLVFLNEFDYVSSDFVVLSDTFPIRNERLDCSKKLGTGVSCNGNNVAYLAQSKTPLNSCGLDRKKLSDVPFEERPRPAISSSYISSTVSQFSWGICGLVKLLITRSIIHQNAVIPTGFPWMLFRGITTYGWPIGYTFLHCLIHKVKHLFDQNSQDMVLNLMGHDNGDGKLTFRKDINEICFQAPSDPFLARKIEALQRLTKKLGEILFMSRYRSTSVHLLGGCCASSDVSSGVCNSNGQVFDRISPTTVYPGLYVCDASLIPCSVGSNPSLTITTAAEHVSKHLVQDALDYKSKDADFLSKKSDEKLGAVSTWKPGSSQRSAVQFKETLHGHVGGLPCVAYLNVKLNSGTAIDIRIIDIRKCHPILRGKVGGCHMERC